MRDQDQLIHEFCKNHNIQNYKITPQGVDVHEDVILARIDLTEFPFQFNVVRGNFNCGENKIESLKNSPRVVQRGYFRCSKNNKLTSLEHAPKVVQYDFYCFDNKIVPWEHRYLLFSEIQGRIYTGNSELNEFFRKYQNQKALIPEALKELRVLQNECEQRDA